MVIINRKLKESTGEYSLNLATIKGIKRQRSPDDKMPLNPRIKQPETT
jgi:hypothetical protein